MPADRADRAGRTAVESRIRPRRLALVALAIALVGVVVAGVVFAVNVVGLAGWRGRAPEATARVLESAARVAARTEDPELGPGQYRRITIRATTLTVGDDDGRTYSWLDATTEEKFVPADPERDWVWIRPLPAPVSDVRAGSLGYAQDQYSRSIARNPDGDGVIRAAGGAFYGDDPGWTPTRLEELPTDPRELLNHLYRTLPEMSAGLDATAFRFLVDRLVDGWATPAQRATFFRALVLIPGTKSSARHDSWSGRDGVVVERDQGFLRDEVLIDPERGIALGQRQVTMQSTADAPAGTPISATEVAVDIVDSAPAGGTLCGTGTGMKVVRGDCVGVS